LLLCDASVMMRAVAAMRASICQPDIPADDAL
jgi:hypothetical protein